MSPEQLRANTRFVRALARCLVLEEHQAEDIAQDTLLAAIRNPPGGDRPIQPWLARVARNFAVSFLRRERRRKHHEERSGSPETAPSPVEIVERVELHRLLIDMVLGLDEPYRTTILFHFFEGLSPRAIASKCGIPVATVRTRLRRGLGQLREKLDRRHGGGRKQWCLALGPLAGLTSPPPAATAGAVASGTGVLAGGVIMTAKVKIVLAIAVAAGLSLTLWRMWPEPDLAAPPAPASPVQSEAGVAERHETTAPVAVVEASRDDHETTPLQPGEVLVFGRVADRATGDAITGADVTVYTGRHGPAKGALAAVTDDKGRFAARSASSAECSDSGAELRISAAGYRTRDFHIPAPAQPGQLDCGDLFLEQSRRRDIRVVDAGKRPVPGAKVRIFDGPVGRSSLWFESVSNEDGVVHITEEDLAGIGCRSFFDDFVIAVAAPGMAGSFCDHELRRFFEDIQNALEIEVESPACYSGRVVDAETEKGIGEAFVRYAQSSLMPHGETAVASDAQGCFSLPRLRLIERGRQVSIEVWAQGYDPAHVREPPYPDVVYLKPHPESKYATCIAIDAASGELIRDTRITVAGYLFLKSDGRGKFRIPIGRYEETPRSLHASIPERHLRFSGALSGDDAIDGAFRIVFEKWVPDGIEVRVLDELGRPVPGAKCRIRARIAPQVVTPNDNFADREGTARFDLWSSMDEVVVVVTHPEIIPYESEPVAVGGLLRGEPDAGPAVITCTVKRGMLFQNIAVQDGMGRPVVGKLVVVEERLSDGTTREQTIRSDQHGLCEVALTDYCAGEVWVLNRPDTETRFEPETIREKRWIRLVVSGEIPPEFLIDVKVIGSGVVASSGRGVKGLKVRIENEHETKTIHPFGFNTRTTDEEGRFTYPAFRGETYTLVLPELWAGDAYCPSRRVEGVVAGEAVTEELVWYRGFMVDLPKQLQGHANGARVGPDVWLEGPSGNPIRCQETVKSQSRAGFYGMPDGIMRVVIRTQDGERRESNLFTVTGGRSQEEIHFE